MSANADALAALQQLVRATIDIAYIDLPPRSKATAPDTERQHELRSAFELAVTRWNAAMYRVLLVASTPISTIVRELDRQADGVTGAALSQVWTREAFRNERRPLGELMAEYIDAVRAETGETGLGLVSIWSWADERTTDNEAERSGDQGHPGVERFESSPPVEPNPRFDVN